MEVANHLLTGMILRVVVVSDMFHLKWASSYMTETWVSNHLLQVLNKYQSDQQLRKKFLACNANPRKAELILTHTRWAPSSYKLGYGAPINGTTIDRSLPTTKREGQRRSCLVGVLRGGCPRGWGNWGFLGKIGEP